MMKNARPALSLDRPATYQMQMQVPGQLDRSWSGWAGRMTIVVESEDDGPPVTTLTGTVNDLAALHGLLRRLYALGLPLISVVCLDCGSDDSKSSHRR
jgi:hypothetical protein